MVEPKKKSSPFPIAKATDQDDAPRPLHPVRKYALPIGVAASMVLAGAGAGAYAYASGRHADPSGEGCPTRAHAGADFFTRTVDRLKDFVSPSPPPRMAGEMVVAVPTAPASGSASGTPPTPPPPPPPDPNPPPLPGKIAPVAPPATHPAAIQPAPQHPKLGGKPVVPNPSSPL